MGTLAFIQVIRRFDSGPRYASPASSGRGGATTRHVRAPDRRPRSRVSGTFSCGRSADPDMSSRLAGATAAHPPCKRVVPGSNPGRGSWSAASAARLSRTCSSTGRAAGLHPVGCRFDSCRAHCVSWSTITLVGVPVTVQAAPQRGSEAEALPVMGLYVAETGNPKALTRQHGECLLG